MPIKVSDKLPAIETLRKENIFVMGENRALHQDIRPLKILVLNLMPMKITTETQLLRQLSNSPLQIEIDLLHAQSHTSTNISAEHLKTFYKTFRQVRHQKYDGMIITGAPVEQMEFEKVDYWPELKKIMDWAESNVTSIIYICWAAQAALYHRYNIRKYPVRKKIFGVFPHIVLNKLVPLLRGFDDVFFVPHSRHTEIRKKDVEKITELEVLSESKEAGVYIVASRDGKHIFITGHSEYDPLTLKAEYDRDNAKGLPIDIPKNYFPGNSPSKQPEVMWRSHSSLLFSNWLNYYVYQVTPYDIKKIKK